MKDDVIGKTVISKSPDNALGTSTVARELKDDQCVTRGSYVFGKCTFSRTLIMHIAGLTFGKYTFIAYFL